jgi:hypothetical protein
MRLARVEERYRLRSEFAATLQEREKFSLSGSQFETLDSMSEEYQIERPSRSESQAYRNQIPGST